VGEAPPERQERFSRIAVLIVLGDGIFDVLPVERILELGGENRDAVEKEHQVEARLRLVAVPELPYRGEEVRRMKAPRLLVEPTRRPKVREPEFAAGVLDSLAEHVERSAVLNLGGEAVQELLPHRRAVMLRELLPLFRLRREHEVEEVLREKAETSVVILRRAVVVSSGRRFAENGRRFRYGRGGQASGPS
jgi:hypothetical protein